MKKVLKIVVVVNISLIFTFYVFMIPIYAFSPSSNEIFEGIDVSHWQGNIDFASVKNEGIDIVYIKASEGASYIDPFFEQNYSKAKENGLYVGVYHYLTATSEEGARQQANFFASLLSGKQIDCKLAMDFESFGNLDREQINSVSIAFLQELQRITGREIVIYSDTSNATNTFFGEVTNYPLWVAEYGVNQPLSNGNWDTWVGFQYTDEGIVSGVNGYVDRNKFTNGIFLSNSNQLPDVENQMPSEDTELGTITIIIKSGDNLSEIVIMYNTTVARLVELNSIVNPNLIYSGESLIVPINSPLLTSDNTIYIVRKGDTLSEIARRYNITINEIVNSNNIKNANLIFVGQRLVIPNRRIEITNDTGHTLYRVRRGDTLYAISRRYGVSIANILRLNRIVNPNLIFSGELLRI